MLADGADIIDIGAQSTRPGSTLLSAEEELQRLDPLIYLLSKNFPVKLFCLSIPFTVRLPCECINAGFSMVNDISGGELDKQMIPAVAALKVPYICMHMRGTPANYDRIKNYDNVTRAVLDYFIMKTEECHVAGIKDIIIDPGFDSVKISPRILSCLKIWIS